MAALAAREHAMASLEQVAELIQKMETERATLVAAARRLSRDEALSVPVDAEGEEQWTALEQLAHLWEMERSYDAWVLAALRQDNPELAGMSGAPVGIPIEKANQHPIDDLLQALAAERAHTTAFIRGIPLEGFERTATSPVFGTLTVMQWLRSFYRHDRQHGAQIQGRQSDYQPNFKAKEPNQRRARIELVARRANKA